MGTDLVPESGYLRAKSAQEKLIQASSIPYTIVRSTQFFEFLGGISDSATKEQTVYLPKAKLQPIASLDVADALLQVILKSPLNGIIDIAGPERYEFSEIIEKYLHAKNDPRTVITDENAHYFGAKLTGDMIVPQGQAHLGATNFKTWLENQ